MAAISTSTPLDLNTTSPLLEVNIRSDVQWHENAGCYHYVWDMRDGSLEPEHADIRAPFEPFPLQTPRNADAVIPIELCETIVDMAYMHDITKRIDHQLAIRTMQSCALVCRASRTRSQYWIFHAVRIEDMHALLRLSSHLEREPSLAELVRKVCVVGESVHAPASPATALPLLLGRRLPNLTAVSIIRPLDPQASRHQESLRQHLPIHPRFPLSFRAFTALDDLHLEGVVFPSFADFARCIQSIDGVSGLTCIRVRWSAPSIPSSGQQVRPLCLPKLKKLTVRLMGIRGMQILISALGVSLCYLDVDVPHFDPSSIEDATDAAATIIDLRPFVNLATIKLALSQSFGLNAHGVDMLRSFLSSWTSLLSSRVLVLEPTKHDFGQLPYPTRKAYASMLRDVGRVAEEVLQKTTDVRKCTGSLRAGDTQSRVVLDIEDIERYQPWWLQQAVSAFPSFDAEDSLELNFASTKANEACILGSARWLDIAPTPMSTTESSIDGASFQVDLEHCAAHIASRLTADGIPPRSVVGFWLNGNSYVDMLYIYATARAGYIPQLFPLCVPNSDIIYELLKKADGRAMIYDPELASVLSACPCPAYSAVDLRDAADMDFSCFQLIAGSSI